jgi:hypothetical protein
MAIKTEEKNFEAAEELAAFCRAEVLGVDLVTPLIDLEDRLYAKTNARTLIVDLRSIEGSVVAQFEHSFIFLSTHGAGQSIYEVINKKFGSPEKFADELGLPARIIYDWSKSNERVARESHDAVASGRLSVGRLAEVIELTVDKTIRLVAQ